LQFRDWFLGLSRNFSFPNSLNASYGFDYVVVKVAFNLVMHPLIWKKIGEKSMKWVWKN
jgi:hypothetical protein